MGIVDKERLLLNNKESGFYEVGLFANASFSTKKKF
jgi:hypothetical protein